MSSLKNAPDWIVHLSVTILFLQLPLPGLTEGGEQERRDICHLSPRGRSLVLPKLKKNDKLTNPFVDQSCKCERVHLPYLSKKGGQSMHIIWSTGSLCCKRFFFLQPKGEKKPSPQWKKGISAWAYVKSQYVLMKLTRMWGCFGTKFQVLFCLFCKQLVLLFKQKTFDVVGFQHSQKVIFVLLDWHAPTPCLPSSWLGEGLVKPTRQTILQIFSCPAFTIR